VVCGLVIGMVPALVGSYVTTPLLDPAWRAASILQSLVSIWILVVIPLLVCQAFYQGLLGILPESEKATSQR
jgi:hypothetical protein